jgi:hypothetical protein
MSSSLGYRKGDERKVKEIRPDNVSRISLLVIVRTKVRKDHPIDRKSKTQKPTSLAPLESRT